MWGNGYCQQCWNRIITIGENIISTERFHGHLPPERHISLLNPVKRVTKRGAADENISLEPKNAKMHHDNQKRFCYNRAHATVDIPCVVKTDDTQQILSTR